MLMYGISTLSYPSFMLIEGIRVCLTLGIVLDSSGKGRQQCWGNTYRTCKKIIGKLFIPANKCNITDFRWYSIQAKWCNWKCPEYRNHNPNFSYLLIPYDKVYPKENYLFETDKKSFSDTHPSPHLIDEFYELKLKKEYTLSLLNLPKKNGGHFCQTISVTAFLFHGINNWWYKDPC